VPPTIEQDILIAAPVDVVWRTVTEPDQVARWFADDADPEAKARGWATYLARVRDLVGRERADQSP
jgi:uncharacterized protein YndB with AHSA1/START domain